MHAYPIRAKARLVLTAAAVAFTLAGFPAAASEPAPAWLSAIGDFVRDGLEPPRTAEDLFREESRGLAKPAPASKTTPVAVAAPRPVEPVQPTPEPAAIAAPQQPGAIAAPQPGAIAAPQAVGSPAPAVVVETSAPVRKAAAAAAAPRLVVAPAAPRPVVAPAELQPRPVIRAATRNMPVPQPAAEPLTGNRIAATATLDQAIRLGGPAGLYAQRVKRPQIVQ
jgi:hypothetical protein